MIIHCPGWCWVFRWRSSGEIEVMKDRRRLLGFIGRRQSTTSETSRCAQAKEFENFVV